MPVSTGGKTRLALALAVCTLVSTTLLFAVEPTEYELKSVFLFNFTQFVGWPESAFESSTSTFNICILGRDPFGATIDDTVKEERVEGHPILVRRLLTPENWTACHILYVSPEMIDSFQSMLKSTSDKPVLTVSDIPEFANEGGMIAFHMVDRHLKVRINLPATKSANLTISSKLLRLSELVGGNDGL